MTISKDNTEWSILKKYEDMKIPYEKQLDHLSRSLKVQRKMVRETISNIKAVQDKIKNGNII